MALYRIRPSSLRGALTVPSSKSHTLRALLFGLLGHGTSVVYRPLFSPDTEAMVQACRLLGASVDVAPEQIRILGLEGKVGKAEDILYIGNSGILLRFLTATASLSRFPIVITGDASIRHQRPMAPLLSALTQLGAKAISTREDGYAPIIVQGPLQGGEAHLCGKDSQPVSALLIAGALAEKPTTLYVEDPGEKPWILLTLDWLDRLGLSYEREGFSRYHLPGLGRIQGFSYTVPGDFSSAAFPLGAALVTGSCLTLHNLDKEDPQGDKKIVEILRAMGASIVIDNKQRTLCVEGGLEMEGATLDINDCIDALPLLAVIGCFTKGQTKLTNASIARHKECDRIQVMAHELRKMGALITEEADGLVIYRSTLKGAHVHSHEDHRIAMALTVAALGAQGETILSSTECIAKTYPSFLSDFRALGADIEEIKDGQ